MDDLDPKELRRAVDAHWNGDTLGALVYRMKTPVLLALLARLERAEADAGRWAHFIASSAGDVCFMGEHYSTKESLDAAVDAARAQKERAMTDRELLELAAKAAGKDIDLLRYDEDDGFAIRHMAKWWNPLADDGDALRLAVKLEFGPLLSANYVFIQRYYDDVAILRQPRGSDPYAATRRAIVREAAEIGRAMP